MDAHVVVPQVSQIALLIEINLFICFILNVNLLLNSCIGINWKYFTVFVSQGCILDLSKSARTEQHGIKFE